MRVCFKQNDEQKSVLYSIVYNPKKKIFNIHKNGAKSESDCNAVDHNF